MTNTVGDLLGTEMVEDFSSWDYTEISKVLSQLANVEAIDLAHAELLSMSALRGADIMSTYLAKIVKTSSYLESSLNSAKNKASLDFKPEGGTKITADMRKLAGEASPEVDQLYSQVARAKGCKVLLEKKYDLLIRSHHLYKEIAAGFKRGIPTENGRGVAGWE